MNRQYTAEYYLAAHEAACEENGTECEPMDLMSANLNCPPLLAGRLNYEQLMTCYGREGALR
jgi:hypothetical protein